MSNEQTHFEEVVGDIEDFQLMLDGAFKDWDGVYDVVLAETDQYLFSPKETPAFRRFCKTLRSKDEGEERCKACDIRASKQAFKQRKPLTYECHAGLLDFAVPIIINDKLLATVFCGQILDPGKKYSQTGADKVKKLETELGFSQGKLLDAWHEIPVIPEEARIKKLSIGFGNLLTTSQN